MTGELKIRAAWISPVGMSEEKSHGKIRLFHPCRTLAYYDSELCSVLFNFVHFTIFVHVFVSAPCSKKWVLLEKISVNFLL